MLREDEGENTDGKSEPILIVLTVLKFTFIPCPTQGPYMKIVLFSLISRTDNI